MVNTAESSALPPTSGPPPQSMLPFSTLSPMQMQQAFSMQQSAQMLNMERLRFGLSGLHPGFPGFHPGMDPFGGFRGFDPRARYIQEEPKPQHSYIGLIAMAILSSPEKKLVLSDIYQWILDNYPYFRTRGPGWRNSIRHNLSLNDCFVKAGRSANGKGHYWAIHPANLEDFKRGDFRRRRAQRKVRRAMGLAVPDEEDDDDDSPCVSPIGHLLAHHGAIPLLHPQTQLGIPVPDIFSHHHAHFLHDSSPNSSGTDEQLSPTTDGDSPPSSRPPPPPASKAGNKRRLFDVESLLAPDFSSKKSRDPNSADTGSSCSKSDGDADSDHSVDSKPSEPKLALPGAPNMARPGLPFNPALFSGPGLPFPFPHQAPQLEPGQRGPGTAGPFPWPFGAFGFPAMPTSFKPTPAGVNPFANPWLSALMTADRTAAEMAASAAPPPAPGRVDPTSAKVADPESINQSINRPLPRSPSPNSAAKWQETFAKIMARSYHGRLSAAAAMHQQQRLSSEDISASLLKSPKTEFASSGDSCSDS